MTSAGRHDRPNILWRFFSSVKLTLALLIVLALVSILGTVIPQREAAMEFAREMSPEAFRLYSFLGLFDIYHSIGFRVLLALLSLNLIICSLDRFPSTWKRMRSRPGLDRTAVFDNVPPEHSFAIEKPVDQAAPAVGAYLQTRFRDLRGQHGAGSAVYQGEKGRYAHFGVYLVHLSVFAILLGGLIGSFFGFEAFVNIVEGEQSDTVRLRNRPATLNLGFSVRCDAFSVEFYDDGIPKEYRSDLSFIEDGEILARASARVNHPVRFRGVTFYQASYGQVAAGRVGLKIVREDGDSKTFRVTAEPGRETALPGGEGHFKVLDARGDFMRMGPAALLSIRAEDGEATEIWVFEGWRRIERQFPGFLRDFPKFNPSAVQPYTFYLEDVESKYYTGLQVNRDPGVPIVWLGFFLMIAGFIVTFFTSHRRVWVRLVQEGEGTRVETAGTASKNPVGLHREMERMTRDMKRETS